MRIVSQDRTESLNFDDIRIYTMFEEVYARVKFNCADILLGKYASEERAAEVFEDIHKKYCGFDSAVFQNIDIDEEQFGELLKSQQPIVARATDEKLSITILPMVYYMPAE